MSREFWHDAAIAAAIVCGGLAAFWIICWVTLRFMGLM